MPVRFAADCPAARADIAADTTLEELEQASYSCHTRISEAVASHKSYLASLTKRLERLETKLKEGHARDTRQAELSNAH